MKKLLIIFIIIGVGEATITRINTLGENREILIDESNIYFYPTQLYFFRNFFLLELIDKPYFLASAELNEKNLLALSVGREDSIFYEVPYFPILKNSGQGEIFYTGVTKRLSIGMGAGISREHNYFPQVGSEEKIENFSFKFGLLHHLQNKILEIGVNLDFPYYYKKENQDILNVDGYKIKVNTRAFLPYKSLNFIPFINFSTTYVEKKDEILEQFKRSWIKGGLGLSYQFGEVHKLYFSWEFNYEEKILEKIIEKEYSLGAFSLGAESNPLKWLILRLGIREYGGTLEAEEAEFTFYRFRWGVGIGIKIGKFRIDGKFEDNFIKKGPYIISGEKTGFSYLTILYHFGGEI